MSLLDDLSNTLSPKPAARPYGLLGDFLQLPQLPAQAQAEAMPSFDFSPTDKQQKNALWSSLARMGAAMLTNNRGGFANALGHGLAAQQDGYQGALERSQNDNVNQFKTSALKDDWQEKQQARQREAGLRQALGELDWSQPGAHKSAAQLLVQAGDYDGAKNVLAMDPTMANTKRFGSTIIGADGQVYQLSEGGPIATGIKADPRMQFVNGVPGQNAPSVVNLRTRESLPVIDQKGVPLPVPPEPLKDMPSDALTKFAGNKATITRIDALLKDLGNNKGSMGPWNYLGDAINQRRDPAGVALRSQIANIGSLIVHDRSGAAVTVGEMSRLTPMIPQETDNAETARKKLDQLRKALATEMQAFNSVYGPENGYKGFGSKQHGYPKPVSQSVPKQVPAQGSQPQSKYVNLNGKNVMAQLDPSNGKYYVNQGGRWMEVK